MDTFYLVMVRFDKHIREYTPEAELPETVDEVLALVNECETEFSHVARILRCDPDIAPEDVTEEIAAIAYRKWVDGGADVEHDATPQFIHNHAPASCDCGYRPSRDRRE